jgi:glutamyl-tRNA reductase
MYIIVVGLNHKTAPVEVRERLAISDAQLPHLLDELKKLPKVEEQWFFHCNRT